MHQCPKCRQLFTRKAYLESHLRRKKPCTDPGLDKRDALISQLEARVKLLESIVSNMQISSPAPQFQQNGDSNNMNITITVNNFGQDNISFLTSQDLKEIAGKEMSDILIEYIRKVNCHPEHKENYNLKISDTNQNVAEVFKNGQWVEADKKELLNELQSIKRKEIAGITQSNLVEGLSRFLLSKLEFVAEDNGV